MAKIYIFSHSPPPERLNQVNATESQSNLTDVTMQGKGQQRGGWIPLSSGMTGRKVGASQAKNPSIAAFGYMRILIKAISVFNIQPLKVLIRARRLNTLISNNLQRGSFCLAKWPVFARVLGHFRMRNGLYRKAKRQVARNTTAEADF